MVRMRIQDRIYNILEKGREPMTLDQVRKKINQEVKHGVTVQELVNYVSADKRICKKGQVKIKTGKNSYPVYEWMVKE